MSDGRVQLWFVVCGLWGAVCILAILRMRGIAGEQKCEPAQYCEDRQYRQYWQTVLGARAFNGPTYGA